MAAGGTLISEGCAAYFGDRGRVGTVQPNYGLDELCGARQTDVEFTPDLLTDLKLSVNDCPVWGGVFFQAYEPRGGRAVGWFDDGRIAAVEYQFGSGHTLLVGSMPGAGYVAHADDDSTSMFFAGLLERGGARQKQHVTSSDSRIKACLHAGQGGLYLWVANPTRQSVPVQLNVAEDRGEFSTTRSLWVAAMDCRDGTYCATIPGDHTDSAYPLQYFFELRQGSGQAWLYPALSEDFANRPYIVVRRYAER